MGQEDHPSERRPSPGRLVLSSWIVLACLAAPPASAEIVAPPSRLFAFLGNGFVPGPTQLTYVRLESDASALWLSFPAPESWRELRLADPPRLVLDLDGVESRLPHAPALYETRLGVGALHQLRTSQLPSSPGDHRVRLTLEFDRAVTCEVRRVGEELRVEIAGGSSSAPVTRELRADGWRREETPAAASGPAASPEADLLRSADQLFRSGRLASAGAAYERWLSLAPDGEDDAWAILQVGNCHWLGGETARAREIYARLVQERPRSIWARVARACLERG